LVFLFSVDEIGNDGHQHFNVLKKPFKALLFKIFFFSFSFLPGTFFMSLLPISLAP